MPRSIVCTRLRSGAAPAVRDAQLASQGRQHQLRIRNWREPDVHDAVVEVLRQRRASGQGETRLADPAGTGQGHEAGIRPSEQALEKSDFALASHQGGQWSGRRRQQRIPDAGIETWQRYGTWAELIRC